MDSATQDLLLQKLEEFIIDEDKIVTVISASELLNISVHDASKLLHTFAEDQKIAKTNVSATYVLSGTLKDGTLGVSLVKQDDLLKKRQLFEKISSEILYSLQKGDKADINSVVSVNGFDASAVKEISIPGYIRGENCVKREIKKKPIPKLETKPVIKGKSSFFIQSASTSNAESKKDSPGPVKIETQSVAEEKASVCLENSESKKNIAASTKKESKTAAKNKPNGGIASFFNKLPTKTVVEKALQKDSVSDAEAKFGVKKSEFQNEEVNLPNDINEAFVEEVMDIDDSKTTSSQVQEEAIQVTKTPETKSNKNKRQRSANKKSDKPSKRRKRIKEIKSDSDSDDMFGDKDEEKSQDIIENSDDEQPVIKTKVVTPPPIKNKRRKLVDKTYEDEEGFIITSKEWVYESASEDEKEQKDPASNTVIQESKHVPVVKAKKEPSPPATNTGKSKKGKKNGAANQRTLMSFFKKS